MNSRRWMVGVEKSNVRNVRLMRGTHLASKCVGGCIFSYKWHVSKGCRAGDIEKQPLVSSLKVCSMYYFKVPNVCDDF